MSVVGHMEQLHQSACYQKSTDLTCVTCHDPHQNGDIKDKTAFYREKCLSCHAKQPCKLDASERLKKEKDNCIACHMPRGDTEIPHIAFTHHRIGRHGVKPPAVDSGVPELLAVEDISRLDPLDRQRNLGIAYFDVYRSGSYPQFAKAFHERAREHLETVYKGGLQDGETTAALAEIYWNLHDLEKSSKYAQQAIASSETSLTSRAQALLFLGDCDRQDRNYTAAIANLEEAVRIRRSADAWRLLGVSYLDQNQFQKAIPALKESLAIRPYRFNTHLGLAEAYRRVGDIPHAKEHLDKAKWLQDHKQN
jgi:tetratricopeptide (TPR) repeat protein